MTEQTATEENALNNLEGLESVEPEEVEGDDSWIDQAEAEREADEHDKAKQAAAEQGAAMAVSFSETLLLMRYPFVELDEGTKGAVEQKAAAVLYKHGGGFPEWLEPYREEMELGMILAVAGFGVVQQVAAHEAEEAERREAERQRHQEGGEYAHQAD